MVDDDGKNRYPQDDIWLSDGYGDYVRHYLKAFAVMPQLAPADEDYILYSTDVIQFAQYKNSPYTSQFKNEPPAIVKLTYICFAAQGTEVIRLTAKPSKIKFNNKPAIENPGAKMERYQWQPLPKGGQLIVNRVQAKEVLIFD